MKTYFKLIEQKRQQAGITIEKLCEMVNITDMTYYNAKSCKSIIAADKFIELCKAVNIKTLEL